MSKHLKEPVYKGKAIENQLLNAAVNCHDLCCGCHKPLQHFKFLIDQQLCPFSTTTTTATEDHGAKEEDGDFDFGPGELEKLFDESDDPTTG